MTKIAEILRHHEAVVYRRMGREPQVACASPECPVLEGMNAHYEHVAEVLWEAMEDKAGEEWHHLIMKQGKILTRAANALNGPPGPLRSWSHHDVGEKAEVLAERARIFAERSVEATKLVDGMIHGYARYDSAPTHADLVELRKVLGGVDD